MPVQIDQNKVTAKDNAYVLYYIKRRCTDAIPVYRNIPRICNTLVLIDASRLTLYISYVLSDKPAQLVHCSLNTKPISVFAPTTRGIHHYWLYHSYFIHAVNLLAVFMQLLMVPCLFVYICINLIQFQRFAHIFFSMDDWNLNWLICYEQIIIIIFFLYRPRISFTTKIIFCTAGHFQYRTLTYFTFIYNTNYIGIQYPINSSMPNLYCNFL